MNEFLSVFRGKSPRSGEFFRVFFRVKIAAKRRKCFRVLVQVKIAAKRRNFFRVFLGVKIRREAAKFFLEVF